MASSPRYVQVTALNMAIAWRARWCAEPFVYKAHYVRSLPSFLHYSPPTATSLSSCNGKAGSFLTPEPLILPSSFSRTHVGGSKDYLFLFFITTIPRTWNRTTTTKATPSTHDSRNRNETPLSSGLYTLSTSCCLLRFIFTPFHRWTLSFSQRSLWIRYRPADAVIDCHLSSSQLGVVYNSITWFKTLLRVRVRCIPFSLFWPTYGCPSRGIRSPPIRRSK